MAFTNSRKQVFSVLLASSFLVQSNLVCLAADSALADASKATATAEQVAAAEDSAGGKKLIVAAATPTALVTGTTIGADETDSITAKPVDTATAEQSQPATIAADTADLTMAKSVDTANAQESQPAIIAADDLDNSDSHTILQSPLLLAASQPAGGFVLSGGASVTPEEAPDRIDQLTKQILLKEIELERYNLHYTQEVAIQGRWKTWRYLGMQQINNSLGLTGGIIGTAYRGSRLGDPKAVKPCIQEEACYIPEVGAYIGAGAAVMEFGINGYHDIIARKHGFSPGDARAKVGGLKNEIDKLMAERDNLTRIESTSGALSGEAELDRAEGKVLADVLDQSLQEFERFHVGARKTIAFQQMQYFFDFTKYVTNGLGYEFAACSLHLHHRRYNGNAGVLFITSGMLSVCGPVVSRFWAKGVGEMTRSNLERSIGHSYKAQVSTLEADLANLDKLSKQTRIANRAERAIVRAGHYEDHEKTYTNEIRAAEKAKNAAVMTASQNIFGGAFTGGLKIAQGVTFTVVGFNHNFRAGADSLTADRVTNTNLFAGGVCALTASAYSLLDNTRIMLRGEINRHKLAAKGMLPGQLVASRLKQLDTVEQKLKTGN